MSESSAAAPALWRHPEFRRGAREMTGVALGISAWGVVAGVAMANSSLSDRNTWLAAAVAGCAAVAALAMPLRLNILVAIAAAVAVGLVLDHTMPKSAHKAAA
jgi:predicted branched-subunit amino acid permease